MSHYVFSLPSTWTYVHGGGSSIGTEVRKADGVVYAARKGYALDMLCNRDARRDAARHARREERLHVEEQLEAYAEVYQRRYARDAAWYVLERADADQWELDWLERDRQLVLKEHGDKGWSPERLNAFVKAVQEGGCYICGGPSH